MSHRGPDGAGLIEGNGYTLGHRRLAVVDLSVEAAQPMSSADGRFVIVYNGELYNDREVREELSRVGVGFRTRSDTETVLAALATWGEAGLAKLRGMFALCFVDTTRKVALVARDALGVKPLYYALVGDGRGGAAEFVFASELPAVRLHPMITEAHDPVVVASYMSTTRTTLGERTLLADVRIVEPATVFRVHFAGERVSVERRSLWAGAATERKAGETAGVIRDSVARHLRSDVPLCSMLSGGLDSSIIASAACEALREAGSKETLRTFASGAKGGSAPGADDFAFARLMAERLGTSHTEAPVTAEMFERRWVEMVARQGLVLSTPNEVAINEVTRALRGQGCIVTLSGEGADELFGGYDFALFAAAQFRRGEHALVRSDPGLHPGEFELLANAWLRLETYGRVFTPGFLDRIEQGEPVRAWFRSEFDRCAAQVNSDDPLAAHLAFQRRVNLAQLLLRLDSASMLESVEGRTPFADFTVAQFAESLPMAEKFLEREPRRPENTKIALRRAFRAELPSEILAREKASFPLPFAGWIGSMRRVILESEALAEIFTPEAITAAAANPSQYWNVAWPMMNLALWFGCIESGDSMDFERTAARLRE